MIKSVLHITLLPLMIFLLMLSSCTRHLPVAPNIVLYIADDLSWWDLGCMGN